MSSDANAHEDLSSATGSDGVADSGTTRTRKHFTAVFEYDVKKYPNNPFLTETPWGRPLAVGIGDAFAETDIYRDALEAIAEGFEDTLSEAQAIAQEALDQALALTKRELEKAPAAGTAELLVGNNSSSADPSQVPGAGEPC